MMTEREAFIESVFSKYNTDKRMIGHGYAPIYAKIPEDMRHVLEIGVGAGASLLAWHDIFPQAMIYGIDIDTSWLRSEVLANPNIHVVQSDIASPRLSLMTDFPESIDLVIDDGSHATWHQIDAIRLFKYRARRYFLIEDVLEEQVPTLLNELPGTIIESHGTQEMFQPPYRPDNRILFAERRLAWER
jgi:cephalosporin hydroxylase